MKMKPASLADLEKLECDFLSAAQIAPVLGIDPQYLRGQAQADASKLGFPVIVTGCRVRIPREGFINYCRHGRQDPHVGLTHKLQQQQQITLDDLVKVFKYQLSVELKLTPNGKE